MCGKRRFFEEFKIFVCLFVRKNGKYVVVYKVVEGVGLKASIDIFSENE